MTNQTIDNSADEQFGNVILWQYDKAVNLCSFINELKTFFNSTTKNIWDEMLSEINVDDATDFGLSILGTLIGCPRPDGISTELYRKILKARFTLMMSNFSVYDINLYLRTIFGEGAISVNDNGALNSGTTGYAPMTLGWNVDDSEMSDEAKSLVEDYPELVFNYPAGVFDGTSMTHHVFAFDGQEAVEGTDPLTGGLDDSNFMYGDEETQYIPVNERITS